MKDWIVGMMACFLLVGMTAAQNLVETPDGGLPRSTMTSFCILRPAAPGATSSCSVMERKST